jgi:hypothetical protein
LIRRLPVTLAPSGSRLAHKKDAPGRTSGITGIGKTPGKAERRYGTKHSETGDNTVIAD